MSWPRRSCTWHVLGVETLGTLSPSDKEWMPQSNVSQQHRTRACRYLEMQLLLQETNALSRNKSIDKAQAASLHQAIQVRSGSAFGAERMLPLSF
jgi:hypothetical protein